MVPSALASQAERRYGGLKDQDRIFTNLYGEQDWRLKGAEKRVRVCGVCRVRVSTHCSPR
jgi:hypothetical protein